MSAWLARGENSRINSECWFCFFHMLGKEKLCYIRTIHSYMRQVKSLACLLIYSEIARFLFFSLFIRNLVHS